MDNCFNVPYHSIKNAGSDVNGKDLYYKHTQLQILQDKCFPN